MDTITMTSLNAQGDTVAFKRYLMNAGHYEFNTEYVYSPSVLHWVPFETYIGTYSGSDLLQYDLTQFDDYGQVVKTNTIFYTYTNHLLDSAYWEVQMGFQTLSSYTTYQRNVVDQDSIVTYYAWDSINGQFRISQMETYTYDQYTNILTKVSVYYDEAGIPSGSPDSTLFTYNYTDPENYSFTEIRISSDVYDIGYLSTDATGSVRSVSDWSSGSMGTTMNEIWDLSGILSRKEIFYCGSGYHTIDSLNPVLLSFVDQLLYYWNGQVSTGINAWSSSVAKSVVYPNPMQQGSKAHVPGGKLMVLDINGRNVGNDLSALYAGTYFLFVDGKAATIVVVQ